MDKASQAKLDSIKKLKMKFDQNLPTKLQELKQLVDKMRGSIHKETLEALKIKVHEIAGIAGVFGYTNASSLSEQFDQNLSEKLERDADQAWLSEFDSFLENLKQAFLKDKS